MPEFVYRNVQNHDDSHMLDHCASQDQVNAEGEDVYHEDSFAEELEELELYNSFKDKYDRLNQTLQDRKKMRRRSNKFRADSITESTSARETTA